MITLSANHSLLCGSCSRDIDPSHERHQHTECPGCQELAVIAANAAISAGKRSGHQVDYQQAIVAECDELRAMLLEKNRRYGSSAFQPLRFFARADALEQLNVRIDDKLSRIRTMGPQSIDEDTEFDLIGYLILRRAVRRQEVACSRS